MVHRQIAVDAHVHFHRLSTDLSAIETTFERSAPGALPAILLVERAGIDIYATLADDLPRSGDGLGLASRTGKLLIVPGRQIVSREGIEVLVYGATDGSSEGTPARAIIEAALADDRLVALPWGFGKWLGARRRLVMRLLADFRGRVFCGDIVGRPRLWREPSLAIHRVLRGSDNLAIANGDRAIGSFGSIVTAAFDPERPVASLFAALRDPKTALAPFGHHRPLASSLRDQVELRWSRTLA